MQWNPLLIQTPMEQKKVSILVRCPYYRGLNYTQEIFLREKGVLTREMSSFLGCPWREISLSCANNLKHQAMVHLCIRILTHPIVMYIAFRTHFGIGSLNVLSYTDTHTPYHMSLMYNTYQSLSGKVRGSACLASPQHTRLPLLFVRSLVAKGPGHISHLCCVERALYLRDNPLCGPGPEPSRA